MMSVDWTYGRGALTNANEKIFISFFPVYFFRFTLGVTCMFGSDVLKNNNKLENGNLEMENHGEK